MVVCLALSKLFIFFMGFVKYAALSWQYDKSFFLCVCVFDQTFIIAVVF